LYFNQANAVFPFEGAKGNHEKLTWVLLDLEIPEKIAAKQGFYPESPRQHVNFMKHKS
jgi:hypothetical protein